MPLRPQSTKKISRHYILPESTSQPSSITRTGAWTSWSQAIRICPKNSVKKSKKEAMLRFNRRSSLYQVYSAQPPWLSTATWPCFWLLTTSQISNTIFLVFSKEKMKTRQSSPVFSCRPTWTPWRLQFKSAGVNTSTSILKNRHSFSTCTSGNK